jgi:hypothetical protein
VGGGCGLCRLRSPPGEVVIDLASCCCHQCTSATVACTSPNSQHTRCALWHTAQCSKVTGADEAALRAAVSRYMPAANGRMLSASVCMFTNTPDGHFLVDWLPTPAAAAAQLAGTSGSAAGGDVGDAGAGSVMMCSACRFVCSCGAVLGVSVPSCMKRRPPPPLSLAATEWLAGRRQAASLQPHN